MYKKFSKQILSPYYQTATNCVFETLKYRLKPIILKHQSPTRRIFRYAPAYNRHSHGENPYKKMRDRIVLIQPLKVVLEGLEPSLAEPESDVLPLHHKTMFLCTGIRLSPEP